MTAAYCLLAAFRGEESNRGIAGALLIDELLDTARAWRAANTKR